MTMPPSEQDDLMERIRAVVREVRDEKPEGHDDYAAACVRYVDYQTLRMPEWSGRESVALMTAALALRPKPCGEVPEVGK